MKMIGMSIRSTATRICRSRRLRSGRVTSSTRQLGARTRGRDRNSCADANVSGCQTAQRISDSSDSRTETSSSTTNTIGVACDIGDLNSWSAALARSCISLSLGRKNVATRSAHAKSGIERLTQSRIAERLEKALHGTLFEHAWTDGLISVSGDEDDRNLFPAKFQFLLEIRSCHARHGDVQDQTPSLVDVIRLEELFRRRERMGRKAQLPEQVG